MRRWQWYAVSRFTSVLLVGYIGWLGWDTLKPHKPEIGPVRREVADRIIPTVVEDIRTARQGLRQAALLHFENDPTDYITDRLRTCVEQSGVLDIPDRTFAEKLASAANLRCREYGLLGTAVARGRQLGYPAVLFGKVQSFETHPGGAVIDMEVNLAEVATGRQVFSRHYTNDAPAASMVLAGLEEKAGSMRWFHRLLGWIIVVLLLPVFTIEFLRAMIRRESNRRNAFVLGIYTLVDALLAYLLVGASLATWLAVVVFLSATAAALAYNIQVMTFAVRLET